jgi:spermidine/putrescine transport system permease protein
VSASAPRAGRFALGTTSLVVYAFLYVPVVVLILFSFNDARTASTWQGFTTKWYGVLLDNRRLREATWNSLTIAMIATGVAVVIGTMLSLALERFRVRGRAAVEQVTYLPVIAPEIVTGVSLLAFFSLTLSGLNDLLGRTSADAIRLGRPTVIIAHVAFCTAFVAIVVRVSLRHFDPRIEEAAQDLGASPWATFWRVTLPAIMPGVIGGALLAFSLSLDNFVITFFVAGPGGATLPIEVFGQLRRTIRPDVNAVSTLLFLASSLVLLAALGIQAAAAKRRRGAVTAPQA